VHEIELENTKNIKEESSYSREFLSEKEKSYPIKEYYDLNQNEQRLICLENDKIKSQNLNYNNPTLSKYIFSSKYLQNISKDIEYKFLQITKSISSHNDRQLSTELIKYEDKNKFVNLKIPFENNVESVMCKNYISIGNKIDYFEDIINNINSSNCKYLHLIFPLKTDNNQKQTQSSTYKENDDVLTKFKSEYYEIGCKIFEVNKILK